MSSHARSPGPAIRNALLRMGAALVGFADLSGIAPQVRHGLPRAVSIAVPLNPRVIAGIRRGPTPEYLAEYHHANALLATLADEAAEMLRQRGFQAVASVPTVSGVRVGEYDTPLPHKTVATRAGLGWIGRCALLVTEAYGSAVRLTAVLTDAPLEAAGAVNESRCGDCRACMEACPGRAIAGGLWHAGLPREAMVDPDACYQTTRRFAPAIGAAPDTGICGACIAACPWTERYLRAAWGKARDEG